MSWACRLLACFALGALWAALPAGAEDGGSDGGGPNAGFRGAGWQGADTCSLLLANGIYNAYTSSQRGAVSQGSFHSALCSSNTPITPIAASSGGGFGVSVEGKVFSLGRSRAEARVRLGLYRSNLCSVVSGGSRGTSGSPLGPGELATISAWVDPNLASSYADCAKLDEQGLSLSHSLSKDLRSVVFNMGYVSPTGGGIRFNSVSAAGPAACQFLGSGLKPGFVLTTANGMHQIKCDRRGAGGVTITIATSAGSLAYELPDALGSPTAEAQLASRISQLSVELKSVRAELASLREIRGGADRSTPDRLAALEQKVAKISYDPVRDILSINTARLRMQGERYCDDDDLPPAPQCPANFTPTVSSCTRTGQWQRRCCCNSEAGCACCGGGSCCFECDNDSCRCRQR